MDEQFFSNNFCLSLCVLASTIPSLLSLLLLLPAINIDVDVPIIHRHQLSLYTISADRFSVAIVHCECDSSSKCCCFVMTFSVVLVGRPNGYPPASSS
jgi:hypothetical protein